MAKYILENRAMLNAIISACDEFGIHYTLFSDDWIIKLEKGSRTRFVYIYVFDINTQSSALIAQDKVALYQLLEREHIPAVPHILLSTIVAPDINESVLNGMYDKYGSVVVKPIRGGRGQSVAKFGAPEAAIQFMCESSEVAWAVSPFIEVDYEMRLVFYKDHLKLAYKKYDPVIIDGLKMFNSSLGAKLEPLNIEEIDEQLVGHSRKSMQAIGLAIGAVDVVFDASGNMSTLEINSGFSLEYYARISDECYRRTVEFYRQVVEEMFA